MTPDAISKFIVQVGVLPAIIAALLYLLWKGVGELKELRCALAENTLGVQRLIDFVRGGRDG